MPALTPDLLARLNQQIANELGASHQYLAMSAHLESEDLPGMASWMRTQADEERAHAMRFYGHVHDRGALVKLEAIEQPHATYATPSELFEAALDHEREVTRQIYDLYEAAQDSKDYGLKVFLNWFVAEQIEEENTFEALVAKVRRVERDPAGLMLLDSELGSAAAAPPA